MKRKILLLTTAVLLCMANTFAQGGTTGPLTWNLNNGALTISGNGAMPNYEEKGAPWYDYWESIDTVIILNGVTTIGNYAFYYCFNLYSITIPTSVISIGRSAFYYCEWLHLTTIPNSVKSIGSFAFAYCKALTSISIPNGITTIEEETFSGCEALTSATIPTSVKSIGKGAFCRTGFTSIAIPNSVTNISDYAFGHCLYLNSISIPNSVTNIADYLFDNCRSLTSITIPKSVTSIGSFAFNGCISLTSITNLNPEPVKISGGEFSDVNISECTLRVPASAVSVYKKANVWKEFKIEGIEVGVETIETNPLKIYPNPTTRELIIDNGQLTITSVEIYDVMGKMQKSRKPEEQKGEWNLDISHLSKGLYFVEIQTKTGNVVRKVVKE